jgi:thioester reductase-like protein
MNILLTGATGALGSELLRRLLESRPGATVHLLLRAADAPDLDARFLKVRAALPPALAHRIVPLPGDISLPDLGLGTGYHPLAGRITEIFHAAASTSFHQPAPQAERHNLCGTRHILDFAQAARRAGNSGRLHYVSTAYVSGRRSGCVREDELECGQDFFNPYEWSKFEAERAVRAAEGLPVTIYRPSVIVGHSLTGHSQRFAGLYPVLNWIHRGLIRALPCRSDFLLDLTPVDYVAEAIVRLSALPEGAGRTFHLTAGACNAVTVGEVIELFLRERPLHALRLNPLRFESAQCERRLRQYVPYLTCAKSFSDGNARALLNGFTVPFCRDYFPQVARFALERGFRGEVESA